ncbi:hypothetical protein KQI82_01660 [Oscillibacter sp. MSJ-2]|uniref:Transposase n=1 Tax=Dysosmobacter acutus TaxID=2841504 RepID=A0ABS6F6G8_9FIRM|nr:hypothetical protein [Dysosmobacter acutus]MBU5625640.1 hypothetical protein [Dysosmobacter acutus]
MTKKPVNLLLNICEKSFAIFTPLFSRFFNNREEKLDFFIKCIIVFCMMSFGFGLPRGGPDPFGMGALRRHLEFIDWKEHSYDYKQRSSVQRGK